MSDFFDSLNRAMGRDILGCLNAARVLLDRIRLSEDDASNLCGKIDSACVDIQKAAQEITRTGGPTS